MTKDKKLSDEEIVRNCIEQFKILVENRQQYESNWQEISDFVTPRRGSYKWEDTDKGNKYTSKIYDSTAVQCAKTMARGLMGTSAPQTTPWFKLIFENRNLNNDGQASKWLEKCTKLFNYLFDRSKLYSALEQLFVDGASIATGCLWVVPHPTKMQIVFRCRHMREIYISTNQYGEVDVIFRKYRLQARDAIKAFGEDKFEDEWIEKAKENPFEKHYFIHATYPREDRIVGKIDAPNKRIASIHYLEEGEKLLKISGYDTSPYIPWRFELNPDEDYGTGPAWDIQSTILRINQERKDTLNLGHMVADPPINVAQENLSTVRRNWKPHGMLPYTDPAKQTYAAQVGMNYPITQDVIADDKKEIQEAFMNNFFVAMLARQGRNATATEINELAGEKTAMLTAIASRMNSEVFNPLFDRVWDICQQKNWLPKPPEVLMGKVGSIKVDYIGPLPQAMKRHSNSQGVMGAMNTFLPLTEIYPEMRDNIDPDELAQHVLKYGGIPETIIMDSNKRDAIRKKRAEAQAEAAELEKNQGMADIAGKASKKIESGSGADILMQAAAQKGGK